MTETSVPDDHKRRVVADFNTMAETYDALRFVQVGARRLVELAALSPGAHVLDIATGTGWAAIAAAQHVGSTGRVLGVDLAPELLERARPKVAAAGLTQVEFREGDAERLDLGDQRFEVVLCASALFFVPAMLAALREWYRVLTPGGQVGGSGFGPTFAPPLGDLWNARLRQYGVSLPTVSPNLRLAEPETCRRLLHEAGFVQTEVQSEQLGYYFRTVAEDWEEVWSSRNRMVLLQLAPAQREQFQAEHLAEVRALATDQGLWRDVAVNFARGWKRPA
jgi:ubiquinone/menaquinone biosynthesis C-methylase UbiE